ncbi:MAG: hypothetical protein KIS96_10385 [Bauldia sp.]|nr:hypothetical protein [Bauldia sp.]
MTGKTLLIDTLVERIASWPEEAQDEAIESLMSIEAKVGETYRTSPEERDAIRRGLADAERGNFVSADDLAAFFKRHGI